MEIAGGIFFLAIAAGIVFLVFVLLLYKLFKRRGK